MGGGGGGGGGGCKVGIEALSADVERTERMEKRLRR